MEQGCKINATVDARLKNGTWNISQIMYIVYSLSVITIPMLHLCLIFLSWLPLVCSNEGGVPVALAFKKKLWALIWPSWSWYLITNCWHIIDLKKTLINKFPRTIQYWHFYKVSAMHLLWCVKQCLSKVYSPFVSRNLCVYFLCLCHQQQQRSLLKIIINCTLDCFGVSTRYNLCFA